MHPLIVEFLGSIFFIIVILATGNFLAIGASLSLIILLGKSISNAVSINPAVSCALYAAGKLDKPTLFLYIIAEVLGGLTGFYIFKHAIKK